MRRDNFDVLMKDDLIGLLKDCIYYCWQHSEISDNEAMRLDEICNDFVITRRMLGIYDISEKN